MRLLPIEAFVDDNSAFVHEPGGLFKRAMWSCISGSSADRRPVIPRPRLAFPLRAL
jgi:hypothetical protein